MVNVCCPKPVGMNGPCMPDTVACGKCGEVLNEPPDLSPENRQPCPKCGSKTRTLSVQCTSGIGVGGSAKVRMRATIIGTGDRVNALRAADNLRRDLRARLGVDTDPEHPLCGIHRDGNGRAYFEFVTKSAAEVREVI